jgi:hypothetical protein
VVGVHIAEHLARPDDSDGDRLEKLLIAVGSEVLSN